MAFSILKGKIRQILGNYHNNLRFPQLSDERDFIRRTATFFKNRSVSHEGQYFRTRAAYIDKSPIVEFFHRTPWPNPDRKEVGDILLVSKTVHGGRNIKHRATIVQSKFTKMPQRSWEKIDTAQLYLVCNWPAFERVNPKPKKLYKLNPNCFTWGMYSLVGPIAMNYPFYLTPTRIASAYPSVFSKKTLTFRLRNLSGWGTSPSFLMKQIYGHVGEDLLINNSIKLFVDELLRMAHIKPDPPDEFEWELTEREEPKGFGVIEFTLFFEN